MEIEVTWKAKPQSGITYINLTDLLVKSKKEWDNLSKDEQEKRINGCLADRDEILPLATEW